MCLEVNRIATVYWIAKDISDGRLRPQVRLYHIRMLAFFACSLEVIYRRD